MIRRWRNAVCWQHLPQVLTWRVRHVGRAGFVVRRRHRGGYAAYPPSLRRGVMGGPTVREALANLERARDQRRHARAMWTSPEFAAAWARLERRYAGTRLGRKA